MKNKLAHNLDDREITKDRCHCTSYQMMVVVIAKNPTVKRDLFFFLHINTKVIFPLPILKNFIKKKKRVKMHINHFSNADYRENNFNNECLAIRLNQYRC